MKVDDIVDDSIVTELEKEGFIDKLYKPVTSEILHEQPRNSVNRLSDLKNARSFPAISTTD